MSTIIELIGILCAVIGSVIVSSIDYDDERKLAAIALGLGIVGGYLVCLSDFIGG